MIKILKASAGSGKTFNLAKTYIRLLLGNEDPHAYRHILAVTFTNKATDEMKSRILKELHLLSTDPGQSRYTQEFVPSMFHGEEDIRKKAENVLYSILHDYGAFAVSTIDRFFQQTLKAFSREIGQFASYQVELDKESLVTESVDRILDSLTEDNKPLLGWLSDSVMDQLEQGNRPNLEGGLMDMAKRLKSDEHRDVTEKLGIDDNEAYSKQNLRKMREKCRKVMVSFALEVKAAAVELAKAFDSCGISPYETSSHFMDKPLASLATMDPRFPVPVLTVPFRKKALDYSNWFKNNDRTRMAPYENILAPMAAKLVSVYEKGLKVYKTAKTLSDQISDLGIASDLSKEFQELLKEKNVLSLDDSNMILRNIIDGSDAPFIYEKLGVRFEHFLLDEFQDTSRVQWDNFRALIANSDSGSFENLLVGDVKQSIYRWRGSDWKLMARDVVEQFPNAVEESLKGNWRSLRNIVEFNNSFFAYASEFLDSMYGQGPEIPVSAIYGKKESQDFEFQEVMIKDAATGSIEAIFCPEDRQNGFILETIKKIMEAGALPGDITILVRNNREGSDIASFLMENGLDVISDDSLHLKSSTMVRKLVSLLSSVRNPDDTIGSYLAAQAGLDSLNESYHSLLDLCERLIRLLTENEGRESFEEETLYIQSFMDFVQDHVGKNGNSIDSFLKAWEEADPMVSSPSDANAFRVMTIHKAKGLEFPYVILPYSENVNLFRSRHSWAVPEVKGTPLEGIGKAAFDVQLSSGSSETLFEEEYKKELLLQYIDNINTYYVALTRAIKGMTIISDIKASPEKNFAGILLRFLENEGPAKGFSKETLDEGEVIRFRLGELYDFSKLERKDGEINKIEIGYPSFPLNPETVEDGKERSRLKIPTDSSDFFTEEGRARNEARENGTILHDILARVKVPSDLERSVLQAVRLGDLDEGKAGEVQALLSERIASHPEWFPEDGTEILNETALFDADGREWRPDRVLLSKDGKVTVIDYKFGEPDPRYRTQVAKYAAIYRRLGFNDVSTFIWYVPANSVD